MMRSFLIALLLASSALVAQDGGAQNNAKTNASRTALVEGSVTNKLTGEPIANATIVLSRDPSGDSSSEGNQENSSMGARTDAAGHFSIAGIMPGRYVVSASHNKFLPQRFGSRHPRAAATVLALSAGQRISNADISLMPAAVIAGQVVDENGEPLVGVNVAAMTYVRRGRRRILAQEGWASTDDRGQYRIFGLAPGAYYIAAISNGQRWPLTQAKRMANLAYVPTYYPGVTDLSQATPIDIQPGSDIPMDLTLAPLPTVRVAGTIMGTIEKKEQFGITLLSHGMPIAETNVQDQQGHFEFRSVPPGNHVLMVQGYGEHGANKTARISITVGTAPLDGVNVILSTPAKIQGIFRLTGNGTLDFSRLFPILSVADPEDEMGMQRGFPLAGVTPDGRFEMTDVLPNEYRLIVTARGSGLEDWYTKTARFGGRDVTNSSFRVSGGSTASLEVVISPGGAVIQGVVKDANDHPAGGILVVTVPEGKLQDRTDLYQTAVTDQLGFFKIRGAAPGDYKVFAWEDVENDAWFDPEFMKTQDVLGTAVSVGEYDRTALSLHVIPASDGSKKQ